MNTSRNKHNYEILNIYMVNLPCVCQVFFLNCNLLLKVIVGHIFETLIKCLFFIRSRFNFVCMFFKDFWPQPYHFKGKIDILFSSNLC